MIPMLIGISLISFFIMHLAPGDITSNESAFNPKASEESRQKLRELYNLDKPIIYLYAGYGLTAIHKKIKGVKKITPPAGVFHNDYEWYIPKKFRRNEMSL